MASTTPSRWFQRFLLPGLAFKAVVIGGGYATGRELAEYFLPGGAWGGLLGLTLAMIVWSIVCAATFMLARRLGTYDYRSFFAALLGRFWVLFEITYLLLVVLIIAVFGAAAGAIGAALFGWPPLVGSLGLAVGIAGFVTFGNTAVEQLFKYVSILLYIVYAIFLVFAVGSFGDRIVAGFGAAAAPGPGWALDGLAYAGYNIMGAAVILPVVRHLTSDRDALVAGLVAGPLAMLPAFIFFVAMVGFIPEIAAQTLPSDFLLRQLGRPWLLWLFQLMVLAALLESGTGAVHAINERLAAGWKARHGGTFPKSARAATAAMLLAFCLLVADRFGFVALIASGYRWLAWAIIAVFVIPVLTIGIARIVKSRSFA